MTNDQTTQVDHGTSQSISTTQSQESADSSALVRFGELGLSDYDPLQNFKLTLNQFYGIIKEQIGTVSDKELIQLGTIALPVDIGANYPWFSYFNLVKLGDYTVQQNPHADYTFSQDTSLFKEYFYFVSKLASLIELRKLTAQENAEIRSLETRIANNGILLDTYQEKRFDSWKLFCKYNNVSSGDQTAFATFITSHYTTAQINDLYGQINQDIAAIRLIRLREYDSAEDKEVIDTWSILAGSSAQIKLPFQEDRLYGEDAKNFNLSYFAKLGVQPDSLFILKPVIGPGVSTETVVKSTQGSLDVEISKNSTASVDIVSEWNGKVSKSGSSGFIIQKPYSFSFSASGQTEVKTDFEKIIKIGFGVDYVQAVDFTRPWYNPKLYRHPKVLANFEAFSRFLGPQGSLLFTPSRVILARGFRISFQKSENFTYDYKSALKGDAQSSGGIKVFGVSFGGGNASGSGSRTETRQNVEQEGAKLTLKDGDNVRLLGFYVSYNRPQLPEDRFFEQFAADFETVNQPFSN
jgi:hypothetical protein